MSRRRETRERDPLEPGKGYWISGSREDGEGTFLFIKGDTNPVHDLQKPDDYDSYSMSGKLNGAYHGKRGGIALQWGNKSGGWGYANTFQMVYDEVNKRILVISSGDMSYTGFINDIPPSVWVYTVRQFKRAIGQPELPDSEYETQLLRDIRTTELATTGEVGVKGKLSSDLIHKIREFQYNVPSTGEIQKKDIKVAAQSAIDFIETADMSTTKDIKTVIDTLVESLSKHSAFKDATNKLKAISVEGKDEATLKGEVMAIKPLLEGLRGGAHSRKTRRRKTLRRK